MSAAFKSTLQRVLILHACFLTTVLSGSAAAQTSSVVRASVPAANFDFGNIPVGRTAGQTNIRVKFSRAGQIKAVRGVLQGADTAEYRVLPGTCTVGSTFRVGDVCKVAVIFTPSHPGPRNGAVVITDASGATLANTFLTGIGRGALATFPNAASLPITDDVGFFSGYAVDGNDNVYFLNSTSGPTQIMRQAPGGSPVVFATVPSGFEDVLIGAMDGAGNLILTASLEKGTKVRAEILRVDSAGNFTRVATVKPQPPLSQPVALGGVAALGNGDLLVGSGAPPGQEVYLFLVHPNGTVQAQFGLMEMYADSFVSDVAVGPTGAVYEGSYGWIYQNTKQLFKNANTDGLAVDASGTLLTGSEQGYLGQPQPCPTPSIPGGCSANPAPPVNQLPYKFPVLNAKGDAYVVYFANPTSPLYKLVRTQPSGVVFSSSGTGMGYGSFAITNSGNQPLDLSNLNPTLGGAYPKAFSIDRNNCGSSLAPAATCSLSLSYNPTGVFPGLPTSASLLLSGLRSTQVVVPLEGFPNQ